MRYRKLGRTGLSVSELSFGTAPILDGFKSYDEMMPKFYRLSLKEAEILLQKAESEGINFYDTATVNEYGDAEYKLGRAFQSIRDRVIIGSRARRYNYEGMKEAIINSLKTLSTDYIDVFYIHQVKPEQFDLALDEERGAIRALREFREKGAIRFLGITSHHVDVFQRSLEVKDLDVYQFPQNLVENGFYPRISEQVEAENIGTIAMKVYGAGPLLDIYEKELLISYVLYYLTSNTALIGIGTYEQLLDNLAAYEKVIRDPEAYTEELIREISELREAKRCNRCQMCHCPKGIRISHILRYSAYFSYYNYQSFSVDRYNKLRVTGEICDECKVCETLCPSGLPISQYIKDAHKAMKKG